MKFKAYTKALDKISSHPARGAWIEIVKLMERTIDQKCRTPQGVRGLKSVRLLPGGAPARSHPARGAWIEIKHRCLS